MIRILLKYSKLIAVLYTLFVLFLCSFPGQYIPTVSFLEILSFDKWVHLSIFFTLTFLWLLTLPKTSQINKFYFFITYISCVLYGGFLEMSQSIIFSHRSTDYLDFIANTIGCTFAIVLYKPLYKIISKNDVNHNCE